MQWRGRSLGHDHRKGLDGIHKMKYGICALSIVPVRADKSASGELKTQLLYGELFKVLEHKKKRSKIRTYPDRIEGFVESRQIHPLSKKEFEKLSKRKTTKYCGDLVAYVESDAHQLLPIVLGSNINALSLLNHSFEGEHLNGKPSKKRLVSMALNYLNAPYLQGGKTPFGVDAAGFVQMVYRLSGYQLPRSVAEQAKEGDVLSFIEESQPGDLAFFDNQDGEIVHVGIMLEDHHIIHAYGKVRLDRIDHTGIFNRDENRYTHSLRVIKSLG